MRACALATLCALILIGCGRDPGAGKVQLRYMAWGNPEQLNLEQHLCDLFNRRNPDVFVRLLRVPGSAYLNKQIVMLATGTAPDVMRVDRYYFPSLVEKHYFTDLTPYARADPGYHLSDFWPLANEEDTYQGKLYAVNTLFGGVMMFYNKTLVRTAGIVDPYVAWKHGTWTWDEFRKDAIAMTKFAGNGDPSQFGCLEPNSMPTVTPVIWAFGGDLLTPDHKHCLLGGAGSIAAFQFLTDLRWKDHCCPTLSQAANSAFTFESGKVGMYFDFMGMATRYREVVKTFDWDIVPIPRGPCSGATIVKGNQLVVPSTCKHVQEAWRFMRFMTSPEIEELLGGDMRRAFPTRIAVARSPQFLSAKLPPYQTETYAKYIEGARVLPVDDRWAEWTRVVQNAQDELYGGTESDVATVMKKCARDVDDVLAQEPGW